MNKEQRESLEKGFESLDASLKEIEVSARPLMPLVADSLAQTRKLVQVYKDAFLSLDKYKRK
jgi:hypothetical protein